MKNCARSVRTAVRIWSNVSIGKPPGLAGVFSISGRRADEHGLGDTLCAVATHMAGDFSASRRVPYMDRFFEVELFDQLREVVRIAIHFVALPWLVRSAVAATVMGDAPISAGSQKQHLVFKCVRAEWPAMAEYDWLSLAPVFAINPCTVFCGDRGRKIISFRFGLRR